MAILPLFLLADKLLLDWICLLRVKFTHWTWGLSTPSLAHITAWNEVWVLEYVLLLQCGAKRNQVSFHSLKGNPPPVDGADLPICNTPSHTTVCAQPLQRVTHSWCILLCYRGRFWHRVLMKKLIKVSWCFHAAIILFGIRPLPNKILHAIKCFMSNKPCRQNDIYIMKCCLDGLLAGINCKSKPEQQLWSKLN